jgi:hypothetical protein
MIAASRCVAGGLAGVNTGDSDPRRNGFPEGILHTFAAGLTAIVLLAGHTWSSSALCSSTAMTIPTVGHEDTESPP